MTEKNRISKWKKYREELDSNENIYFSIANSDEELKKIFKSINFNIEESYKKSSFYTHKKEHLNSKNDTNEKKEIEKILSMIEKNENTSSKNNLTKEFNSHKNDKLINELFLEFIDRKDLQNSQDHEETTDLKIKKINIEENKER